MEPSLTLILSAGNQKTSEILQLCEQDPERATTSPKAEPMETEEKDMRTRPVPACHIRGPPPSKPQGAKVSCEATPTDSYRNILLA